MCHPRFSWEPSRRTDSAPRRIELCIHPPRVNRLVPRHPRAKLSGKTHDLDPTIVI